MLKITTIDEEYLEQRVVSIEVWGKHPEAEIGTTGQGLKLGDPVSEVRRIYGLRSFFGVTLSDQAGCGLFAGSTAPTLLIEFDGNQRIDYMGLWTNKNSCISY